MFSCGLYGGMMQSGGFFFFFQAEDGIRDYKVTGVQTCALPISIGYSANTVSLLALVLAIGIVVDDAIVVIENVERVIEEEPELSIPDATKKEIGRASCRERV